MHDCPSRRDRFLKSDIPIKPNLTAIGHNSMDDIELNNIAEEIGDDIDKIGVCLGHSWTRVQSYKSRNHTEICSGTKQMLHSWKKRHPATRQRDELVNSLQRAELIELAERVQEGEFIQANQGFDPGNLSQKQRTWIRIVLLLVSPLIALFAILWTVPFCVNLLLLPPEIKELRGHLIRYYDSSFCDIKTVPWNSSSFLDLDDIFISLNLHREVSKDRKLLHKPISHTDLFKLEDGKGRVGRRILLRGAPGTGKTTLTCKIARDWGRCLSSLSIRCTHLMIVLQLSLIDPNNSLGQEVLNQGLVPRDRQGKITADLINDYISQYPESAIIVLDGYNEYIRGMMKDETQKGLFDILRYRSFRDTIVMVTCRPWHVPDFTSIPDYIHVEVTGFTSEDVVAYVRKLFGYNETKSEVVLDSFLGDEYLDSKNESLLRDHTFTNEETLCNVDIDDNYTMTKTIRNPLFLTIFCETLTMQESTSLDFIMQFIYEIYRDKLKDHEKERLISFDNLKVSLGKIAFDGLCRQPGQSLNADEMDIFRLGIDIGYFIDVPEQGYYPTMLRRHNAYSNEYIYQMIQEYFASCYFIDLYIRFPKEAERKFKSLKQRIKSISIDMIDDSIYFSCANTGLSSGSVSSRFYYGDPEVEFYEGTHYTRSSEKNISFAVIHKVYRIKVVQEVCELDEEIFDIM